jgi:hypothetical protein
MLKPNYHWKEKGKNYKIWVYHGNNYFGFKRTRGIYEVLINGYVVRFISQYSMPQFPFPPFSLCWHVFNTSNFAVAAS